MAALVLADRVVTLVPQPAAGVSRADVRAAVRNSPRYLRLMESWRWSSPLWNCGLISSGVDDEECSGELAGVYESIASEDALTKRLGEDVSHFGVPECRNCFALERSELLRR